MSQALHIFALNTESDVRRTHLTRAQGDAADLPDLAAWLRVDALDTDTIEMFPVKDLDDMALSDYIALAFATEAIPASDRLRLDALSGSVLLVPDTALPSDPAPGADVTLVATLPVVQPDHSAALPKTEVTASAPDAPAPPPPAPRKAPPAFLILMLLVAVLSLLILVVT